MEFCQSNLPQAACIGMSAMAGIPALACLVSSLIISRKNSFVFELKNKPEFEENTQLIERSSFKKMVKQVTSLLNSIVSLVFLTIYVQEPTSSIIVLAFYSIQVALYIVFAFLLQAEHKRQGETSNVLIANYVLNFLIQGAMGTLSLFEHTLDTHCYALLIILQCISLVNLVVVVVMKNEFTSGALQLQKVLFKTIRHKSTAITNNLLDQSGDQESMMYAKDQDINEYVHSTSSTIKKLNNQSVDSNSFKDLKVNDSNNILSESNLKRKQSVNSRSETSEVREILNNRLTPSFSNFNKLSVSNLEEEPKTYLYAYRDIKVIGYKTKEQTMQFVIQYFRGIKQYKTYRTHRDFKYLNQKMSLELTGGSLFLPQLPKRIQKTGALDKKLLNDKVTKYNRFLNYIEFNKIESKEFSDFLLPNKDLQNYAPLSEKKEGDIESFISSCSPSESLPINSERDSIKIDEKPSISTLPVSPSSFSRTRVQSEANLREKSSTIYLNNEDKENKTASEENMKQEIPKQEIKPIVEASKPAIQVIAPVVEQVKSVKEEEKEVKKQSTLSNSTQASSSNRFRSSTASTSNNKLEEKRMILSSRRRQLEESREASFITQSEQQSLDSSYDNQERQASALSEGQESASIIENSGKSLATTSQSDVKIAKRPSIQNSTSLVESNSIRNSSHNMKSSAFSFSKQGQSEQSTENLFFKMPNKLIPLNELLIMIPQTKEISGKTFYEIEFYYNGKKVHNIDRRYNNFKEFHLTMKSELKKSNQISLLIDLPYKPASKSSDLVGFRKTKLADYLTEMSKKPAIANSNLFKEFIEWKY